MVAASCIANSASIFAHKGNEIALSGAEVAAENNEIWFLHNRAQAVRNVVVPTLTPFLPRKEKATGTAVVIAPGGGFMMLSMESEGWVIAERLAEQGIAAFVLKYRLQPTPLTEAGFKKHFAQKLMSIAKGKPFVHELAVDDGQVALQYLQQNANNFNIASDKIGILGFSAGGRVAISTLYRATATPANSGPAFVAHIYGGVVEGTLSKASPPVFVVFAADDRITGDGIIDVARRWRKNDARVELHMYQRGGHGFGQGFPNNTNSTWLGTFVDWLAMNKL